MSEVEWDREYYGDGTLMHETPYVNGQKHGMEKWYHKELGHLESATPYVNGQIHGAYEYYYEDDEALKYEAPWVNGLPHGVQKWYSKDGTLILKEYWINGQREDNLTPLEALVIFGEEL